MKRIVVMVLMLVAMPVMANATFGNKINACVELWADMTADGGAIVYAKSTPEVAKLYGDGAGIFCPDEDADSCNDDYTADGKMQSENVASVYVSAASLKRNQRALNHIFNGEWGHIPSAYVKLIGNNLAYQQSAPSNRGNGGGHWTIIGDLSAEEKARLKLLPYPGGRVCGQGISKAVSTKPSVSTSTAKVAAAPSARKAAEGPCGKDPCLNAIKKNTDLIPAIKENTDKIPEIKENTDKIPEIKETTDDIKKSVGTSPSSIPLHVKIGEPAKKGDTVMGKLDGIEKAVKDSGGKICWLWWFSVIPLILLALFLLAWAIRSLVRRNNERRAEEQRVRDEDLRRREEEIRAEARAQALHDAEEAHHRDIPPVA